MQALHERGTHRAGVDRESLPEIWKTNALRASRPMLAACVALGLLGAAGLVALLLRWAWIPLMCVVAGMFGLHGLAVQHAAEPVSSRALTALTLLQIVADLVAVIAALVAALNVLAFAFGGTVGLMRG